MNPAYKYTETKISRGLLVTVIDLHVRVSGYGTHHLHFYFLLFISFLLYIIYFIIFIHYYFLLFYLEPKTTSRHAGLSAIAEFLVKHIAYISRNRP